MPRLLLLKSMGWPVLRLRVQLWMAEGMFGLIQEPMHKDLSLVSQKCDAAIMQLVLRIDPYIVRHLEYRPGCKIDLPLDETGRKSKAYAMGKFPSMSTAAAGKLALMFIHWRNVISV